MLLSPEVSQRFWVVRSVRCVRVSSIWEREKGIASALGQNHDSPSRRRCQRAPSTGAHLCQLHFALHGLDCLPQIGQRRLLFDELHDVRRAVLCQLLMGAKGDPGVSCERASGPADRMRKGREANCR